MTFDAFRTSNTRRALFHIGDLPIDATNLLVGLHVITSLVFTFASGWFAATWASNMVFSPSALQELRLWTLLTYPFVHELGLLFALFLYFFWRFGGDLESVLGTTKFLWFYAAVTALPALGLFALSPIVGNLTLAGTGSVHFAVFVGFALLFPNAQIWFGIPIKWFIIIIVGVQTLQFLGYKAWGGLAGLWLSILTAFVFLHREGVGSCQAMTAWMRRKLPQSSGTSKKRRAARKYTVPSIGRDKRIDAILDKISTTGFQSLTAEEKAILNDVSSKYSNRKRK